jgi:glycosyltransferase involved in cell wall biosynthesis
MISYNHEAYIDTAVESVFAQEYPGDLRVIIGDDASTDGTQRKLQALKTRAPIDMELVLRSTNVGGRRNLEDVWNRATGSYIAVLEGDDYWTRPDKLARQISRLEALPSATLAFSRAEVLDETTSPPTVHPPITKTLVNPRSADLLEENILATCTAVYRRGVVVTFPDWFENCAILDWPIHALHAAQGEIIYLDEVQAMHRLHPGGSWTAMNFTRQLAVLAGVRERIWREVGKPSPAVVSRLRAHDLAARAAGAPSRGSCAALLRRAFAENRGVVKDWLFLFGTTRVTFGDTIAGVALKWAYRAKRLPAGLAPGSA